LVQGGRRGDHHVERGAVSQWDDKSGNANHVTQATGSEANDRHADDQREERPRLRWRRQPLKDERHVAPRQLARLHDCRGRQIRQRLGCRLARVPDQRGAASDFSWSFGRNGINNMGIRGYQGTPANQAAFNDNTTNAQLLSGIATTTLRQIWQNGTSKATNTSTDSANTAGRIYIGSDNNPTGFLDGKIAEIIIIEGTDQTTREKAEGYLAWEWGLEALA
jgi:hypothetical protein